MIYLDNAATTKVYNEVIHLLNYYNTEMFFNPSSLSAKSSQVARDIGGAREAIAEILGCTAGEFIFTGSGSEADNTAIRGIVREGRGNAVTCVTEHPAVYNCFTGLKSHGHDVRFCAAKRDGSVDVDSLLKNVDSDTKLVSVMHVNNETGAINDIAEICAEVKRLSPGCKVHCDGVQAFCKIPTDVTAMGVDMYSVSGHKIHAPKGIGGLYVRKGLSLRPLIYGGEQEFSKRAGTENVASVIAMAQAAKTTSAERSDYGKIKRIMWRIISDGLTDIVLNSPFETCADNILNVSIAGIRAEVLQHMLEDDGILIGLGSACSSRHRTSRVTDAIGLKKEFAEGTVRLSFSAENTAESAEIAADRIVGHCRTLRKTLRWNG